MEPLLPIGPSEVTLLESIYQVMHVAATKNVVDVFVAVVCVAFGFYVAKKLRFE